MKAHCAIALSFLLVASSADAKPKKNGMEQTDSERIADEIYDGRGKQMNARQNRSNRGISNPRDNWKARSAAEQAEERRLRQQAYARCAPLRALARQSSVNQRALQDLLSPRPSLLFVKDWARMSTYGRLTNYEIRCKLTPAEFRKLTAGAPRELSAKEKSWRAQMDANNAQIERSKREMAEREAQIARDVAARNAARDATFKAQSDRGAEDATARREGRIAWEKTQYEFEKKYTDGKRLPPQVIYGRKFDPSTIAAPNSWQSYRPVGFDALGKHESDPTLSLTLSEEHTGLDWAPEVEHLWAVRRHGEIVYRRRVAVAAKTGVIDRVTESFYCAPTRHGICLGHAWRFDNNGKLKFVGARTKFPSLESF